MNLSVIQTENFSNDPAALGCYLSVNSSLIDIITPLHSQNSENITEIPLTGTIEFVIKDMRKDEVLGTFLGQIESISSDSQQWLSLNSSITPAPKILVSFNSQNSNIPSTTSLQNTTELLNKIRELNTTVLELETKLGIEKETKDKEINSKTQMLHELQMGSEITLEQYKIKFQNSFRIIQELTKQKENFIRLCEQEQQKVKVFTEQLKVNQDKYEAMCESLQKNSLAYIEENSELHRDLEKLKKQLDQESFQNSLKDSKISELMAGVKYFKDLSEDENETKKRIRIMNDQISELKEQNKILLKRVEDECVCVKDHGDCEKCLKYSEENSFLKSRNEDLSKALAKFKEQSGFIEYLREHSFFQDSEIHSLKNEIVEKNCEIAQLSQKLEDKNVETEVISSENKEIIQECAELKKRIIALTKTVDVLEREITNIKCKNITERKIEKIKLDKIDFALEQYLCEQGIENLFVKMAHGVYLYGTKRVNIFIKNDNRLICRTGGGYTPIDQFLKFYQNTKIEEISRYVKKQSLFLSQGSSPIRSSHKRASSITPDLGSQKVSPKENQTERFEKKILDKLSVVYPLRDRNYTPLSRASKIF